MGFLVFCVCARFEKQNAIVRTQIGLAVLRLNIRTIGTGIRKRREVFTSLHF